MKIQLVGFTLNCIQENNEKFYSESVFLHNVKKELQKKGLDIIKIGQTGIGKDGHLISNDHILTHRKRLYCFYDSKYAIRDIAEDFRTYKSVDLTLHLLNCDEIPQELNRLKVKPILFTNK